MKIINRIGISVTPREPYFAWTRSLDDHGTTLEESAKDFTSIYLVEDLGKYDAAKVIRKHYAAIFEEQLNAWYCDETVWPKRRAVTLFREWFDAKVVEMVWDLGRGPIVADE